MAQPVAGCTDSGALDYDPNATVANLTSPCGPQTVLGWARAAPLPFDCAVCTALSVLQAWAETPPPYVGGGSIL
jgi:hypothetical protein